jgi:hypothetical protein
MDGRCTATTRAGTRCRRTATPDGATTCRQHTRHITNSDDTSRRVVGRDPLSPSPKTDEIRTPDVRAQPPSFPQGAQEAPGSAGGALWDEVTAVYVLDPGDRDTLAAACRTLDELSALEEALDREPAVVVGSQGQPRPNPLFAEVRAHRVTFVRLMQALALPGDEGADRSAAGRALARKRWGVRGSA